MKKREDFSMFSDMIRKRIRRRRGTSRISLPAVHDSGAMKIGEDILPEIERQSCFSPVEEFSRHMARYQGKTVTVFVSGGGFSGRGFTGVLLLADAVCVRLLLQPGPPPACPLSRYNTLSVCPAACHIPAAGRIHTVSALGAIACIPADKITSFVHHAV